MNYTIFLHVPILKCQYLSHTNTCIYVSFGLGVFEYSWNLNSTDPPEQDPVNFPGHKIIETESREEKTPTRHDTTGQA